MFLVILKCHTPYVRIRGTVPTGYKIDYITDSTSEMYTIVNDNGTTYVDRYVDLGIYKGNWWTRTDSNNWNNYQRSDGDTDSITIKMSQIQYTVTYDGNGGTYNGAKTWSEKVVYNAQYKTWENFFDRPGFTFIGWNESADGTGVDWTNWIGKPWK